MVALLSIAIRHITDKTVGYRELLQIIPTYPSSTLTWLPLLFEKLPLTKLSM